MPRLRGRFARLVALLVLIVGLIAPAAPGFAAAAPAQPSQMHAAMDCGGADRHSPTRHVPGAIDCCVANVCAMNLALPASPSGIALPVAPKASRYELRTLLQPIGIEAAPIPHPPKTTA